MPGSEERRGPEAFRDVKRSWGVSSAICPRVSLSRPPSLFHSLAVSNDLRLRACLTSAYDVTVPDENAIRYLSAERQFESAAKPRLD